MSTGNRASDKKLEKGHPIVYFLVSVLDTQALKHLDKLLGSVIAGLASLSVTPPSPAPPIITWEGRGGHYRADAAPGSDPLLVGGRRASVPRHALR